MTLRPAILLLALHLGVVPAFAQRGRPVQRWPGSEGQGAPAPQGQAAPAPQGQGERQGEQGSPTREREAQPRNAPAPRVGRAPRPEPEPSRPQTAEAQPRNLQPPTTRGGAAAEAPREARERTGDNRLVGQVGRDQNAAPRVAVPRPGPPARVTPPVNRYSSNVYGNQIYGNNLYIVRPPAYRYTPRFYRPYAYGALGAGYYNYGSYGWYPQATYYYDGGYFGRGYGYDIGEVRLRVEPRWAEVYVDGFFAGTVDEFDGASQSLKLESGPYHIEIVAPGYETLEVDLRVTPGQKITYRGGMRREF